LRVELDIFSGRPNPVWALGELELVALEIMIKQATPSHGSVDIPGLGYRGFIVYRPEQIRIYRGKIISGTGALMATGTIDLDFRLLESGKMHIDHLVYEACLNSLQQS
jgi:hypothetical protein